MSTRKIESVVLIAGRGILDKIKTAGSLNQLTKFGEDRFGSYEKEHAEAGRKDMTSP